MYEAVDPPSVSPPRVSSLYEVKYTGLRAVPREFRVPLTGMPTFSFSNLMIVPGLRVSVMPGGMLKPESEEMIYGLPVFVQVAEAVRGSEMKVYAKERDGTRKRAENMANLSFIVGE